jgi:hypothetical protein
MTTELFNTDDGSLSYKFVKNGLENILEGPKFNRTTSLGNLTLVDTFRVEETPEIGEMKTVPHKYYHRSISFEGYDSIRLELGKFFLKGGSPKTPGGKAGILVSNRRLSILDFIQELLGESSIDADLFEQSVIDSGITFSIKQVMNILTSDNTADVVARPKKGSIFLVHNSEMNSVGGVSISSSKKYLYGKNPDDIYPYSAGTLFVVRNIPSHLKQG